MHRTCPYNFGQSWSFGQRGRTSPEVRSNFGRIFLCYDKFLTTHLTHSNFTKKTTLQLYSVYKKLWRIKLFRVAATDQTMTFHDSREQQHIQQAAFPGKKSIVASLLPNENDAWYMPHAACGSFSVSPSLCYFLLKNSETIDLLVRWLQSMFD